MLVSICFTKARNSVNTHSLKTIDLWYLRNNRESETYFILELFFSYSGAIEIDANAFILKVPQLPFKLSKTQNYTWCIIIQYVNENGIGTKFYSNSQIFLNVVTSCLEKYGACYLHERNLIEMSCYSIQLNRQNASLVSPEQIERRSFHFILACILHLIVICCKVSEQ